VATSCRRLNYIKRSRIGKLAHTRVRKELGKFVGVNRHLISRNGARTGASVFLHDTYTKYKSCKCSRKFRRKFLTRPFQTWKRIYYYVKRSGNRVHSRRTHNTKRKRHMTHVLRKY
jgi:hypothetical protein